MVESIHYLSQQTGEDLAWKLVARNMSDLAAKGARPLGVLLSYQLGRDDPAFVRGLSDALMHYGAVLLGGDTVSHRGPRTLGVTAIGRATFQPAPSRSGAQPGDGVWITGPLGTAMIAFEALKSGQGDSLPYRRGQARLGEGEALAPLVNAMMDISDGLLLDAKRMAEASGISIAIDSGAVPIACPQDRRREALTWGEDYELLFTAPADVTLPIPAFRIGTVLPAGPDPLLVDGKPPPGKLGYEHG